MARLFQALRFCTQLTSAIILTVLRSLGRGQGRSLRFKSTPIRKSRFRPYPQLPWLLVAMVCLSVIGTSWFSRSPVEIADAAMAIQLPLSTRNAKIVDATGAPVLLRGVNWFGIETQLHAPDGLSNRDYKDMLAQIKSLGYNLIRLPYSVQSLRSSAVSGINFNLGSNGDLQNKSPLQIMDTVIQEAGRQGLLVLLDSHRLNDQRIPELWYGDGFTEADWIDTWKMLALRYKNQTNVIGADLKNEPHGRASWGTNDPTTDWRLAAQRAGNAILSLNPNWLIVVEGVERNVPGQKLLGHWQGGNLEGVGRYPVRLSVRNKLVYSPHEYGPGVYNQPWFSEASFPGNLSRRWQVGFQYIADQKIAPILIGEFGGRQVDTSSKEGIWQRQFVNHIWQKNLSFAYWSWNPNSGDTGGILQDDWQTVNTAKQELLQGLLSAVRFPPASKDAPQFIGTPPSSNPSEERENTQGDIATSNHPVERQPSSSLRRGSPTLSVTANLHSDWQTGFCVSMQVTNQSNRPVQDWQLAFQMNQAAINNTWNGNFQPQGSRYVVKPLDWGRAIEPNQVRELGFCANKLGSDYRPTRLVVSQEL